MADKRKSAHRRSSQPHKNPKPRTLGISLIAASAAAIGLGAATLAILFARRGGKANPAEHAAPDLALDRARPGPNDRAPDAFRPDPTAPVPAALRDSLRPATGPAPSMAADHGTTVP